MKAENDLAGTENEISEEKETRECKKVRNRARQTDRQKNLKSIETSSNEIGRNRDQEINSDAIHTL